MRKYRFAYLFSLCALVAAGLLVSSPAHAIDWSEAVSQFLGNAVAAIVWVLGKVLVIMIYLIVWVAQYNGFIKSSAVSEGWIIVRDICNMFFIVILLIIAFGTVLNQEKYSWKHLLPKVLIAAVLINFSKLICGILIDFAQVVMLSFVNGFRDIAGGNFANMAGIQTLLGINNDKVDVTPLSLAGTYVLALLYVIVALVVMIVILFILIMRIVMIWILVVLSPLAYFLHAVPGKGETYAGKWWEQFTSYLISGPLLAFFIWLSFVAVKPTSDAGNILMQDPHIANGTTENEIKFTGEISRVGPDVGLSDAGKPEGMLKFIISIGLLIGGMMITSQLSGMAGTIAGTGMSKIKDGVKGLKKFGANRAKVTGKFAAQNALRGVGAGTRSIGDKINKRTGGKYGESLQKSGAFLNSWGADIKKTRKEAKEKKRKETLEALGMKEGTADKLKDAANTNLGRAFKGGATALAGAAAALVNPLGGLTIALAGAGHIATALGTNWAGREAKDAIVASQREKNMSQADASMAAIEERKEQEVNDRLGEDPAAAMERVIDSLKQGRDNSFRDIDLQAGAAARNARNSGGTQAEIDAIYAKAEADKRKLAMDVELQISQTRENFQDRINAFAGDQMRIRAEVDAIYEPQLEEIRAFKDENRRAIERDSGVKDMEKARDAELKENESDRNDEYKNVKAEFSQAPKHIREAKLDAVNTKYAELAGAIKDKHGAAIDGYKESFGHIGDTTLTGLHSMGGSMAEGAAKYQPNRLTIEGAKLLSKELKEAKDFVRQLSDPDVKFSEMGAGEWASGKGIDSSHKKKYKILASGTAEAKQALANLKRDLAELKSMTKDDFDKDEKGKKLKDKVEKLKKGIAYYIKDEHDGAAAKVAFKDVIEELEQIDTGHKNGKKLEKWGPKENKEEHSHTPKTKTGGGGHTTGH